MTLDVKALRARAEAGWDETLTAEQLLALLDRLERAEKVVTLAQEWRQACNADGCDVAYLGGGAADRAGAAHLALRAALDDEAPR